MRYLFLLVFPFFFAACGNMDNTELQISTTLRTQDTVILTSISANIYRVFSGDTTQTFRFVENVSPAIFNLTYADETQPLLALPNAEISVTRRDSQLLLTAPPATQLFHDYEQLRRRQVERLPNYQLATLPAADFREELNQKYAPLQQFINNTETTDTAVISVLQRYLNWQRAAELLNYPAAYADFHRTEPSLPPNYYDFLDTIQYDLPYLADLRAGREFGRALLRHRTKKDTNRMQLEYERDLLYKVDDVFKTEALYEFFTYDVLERITELDYSTKTIQRPLQNLQLLTRDNPYVAQQIRQLLQQWATFEEGAQFADFQFITANGEKIQLSDFYEKNKYLYLDIWATWCGPCLAERPFLAKLQRQLGEELQIIQISVDEDQARWQNFVAQNTMTGVQLWTAGGLQSELARTYRINKIPRFILLDADGKIVDSNAPPPSIIVN